VELQRLVLNLTAHPVQLPFIFAMRPKGKESDMRITSRNSRLL